MEDVWDQLNTLWPWPFFKQIFRGHLAQLGSSALIIRFRKKNEE